MNRIITILVTIFILLLLYIWISHVWGGDKPRHPRQIVDAREGELSDKFAEDTTSVAPYTPPVDSVGATASSGEDEYATERNVTEEEPQEEVKTEPVKTEPVKPAPKPEPKKTAPVKTEPKKTTTTSTPASKPATTSTKTETKPAAPAKPATTTVSGTDGQHLVIAGNFTQKANAEQRVAELKKAGYKDAEVINFDLSEYHTVCVGRFSDVNEARKLVKKLKDYQKIDAYVRIGG
jgi:cell division protein FtsN